MNTQLTEAPVTKQANTLKNAYWYNGCLINVLVDGAHTNGRYAQLEMVLQPGTEPPTHTHSREDETFYMLEGSIQFTIGEHVFTAKPGDYVVMPKGIPHNFRVLTKTAKTVMTIAPAGFENYFRDPRFAIRASMLTLPPAPQGPPSPEAIQSLVQVLDQEFGVMM
jgi:quercetin dioxygenase-like cupin family protein